MKATSYLKIALALVIIVVSLGIVGAMLFGTPVSRVAAKNTTQSKAGKDTSLPPSTPAAITNSPLLTNTVSTNATSTNSISTNAVVNGTPSTNAVSTNAIAATPGPGQPPQAQDAAKDSNPEQIQLSFQGANIDMIVQWLAKTTGKSVIKHPRVQCQLNIVSSKKITPREAINLVYRALALEGFASIESSNSILILPEGQDAKMSPELIENKTSELPEGRQRLIKIFPLKHIDAAELKEKIRPVLSEKGTIDISDRSNQIIITDSTENIRLAGELINELDVASPSDSVIEFYTLKFSEADELANLLALVINSQPAPPSSPSSSSSRSSRSLDGGGSMPPGMSMSSPSSSPAQSSGGGAPGSSQVHIWTDKTSNRLIVSAPRSKLPEVKRLIDLLDTEKPQDVSIRIMPLKNVTAEDLARDIAPLYQKMSGKSLKDTIEVTASTRSNSLIVLSSEANYKALERLVASLDTTEAQEKITRVFNLKNGDADDVAKQLQDLNQDQDSSSRYPYYIFYGGMNGNNKGGKKFSVVADKRRNSVIVQAPPGAMENIEHLIQTLDEPVSDDNLAPKIFRLKYVSATDIEDVLNELFLKKQQQRNYWDPYSYNGNSSDTGEKQAGRLYGKVRITSEPYSNAIIVTSNSPENLAAVEGILKQLDVPSEAGETTLRISLKFAKASTVANNVNILFAKGGSPPLRPVAQPGQPGEVRQPQQQTASPQNNFELEQEAKEDVYFPWLGGQQENLRGIDGKSSSRPVSDLVGRVRVVPDKRSNSLLVTCGVHFFPEVLKLVNELDAPTAQVLIEAKIVEVSGDFRDHLGVRWSPDGTTAFNPEDKDNALMVRSDATYKKVFTGSALADSLRTGVLNTSINLDFLVQFLRKNTDSKVLAEPQINIADNELGKLFVGSQVPFISGSLNTDVGGRNDTFQYRDVGIILEVTPHINDAEEVALKIRTESSSIRSGETLFGGAILDTRNFKTDLMVKSGQTIVLGGIIQRELVDTMRKTPGLGNIPGFGWAFKKKDKTSREVELLVFLRPWITRSPEDAQRLLEQIKGKAPLIDQWNNEQELNNGQDPGKNPKK